MQIEKGVPLPTRKAHFKRAAEYELLERMEIGDSVLFADLTSSQIIYNLTRELKPLTYTIRKQRPTGFRVWRIA